MVLGKKRKNMTEEEEAELDEEDYKNTGGGAHWSGAGGGNIFTGKSQQGGKIEWDGGGP